MSNLSNIIDQLNDLDKLKAYAKAQFNSLVELNKKITRLEAELQEYKVKYPGEQPSPNSLVKENDSDEEIICKIQLDILKKKALNGEELTLDDAKRLELYTKILITKAKKSTNPESKLTDEELLKIVENKPNG